MRRDARPCLGANAAARKARACLPVGNLVPAREAAARGIPGSLGVDVVERDLGAAAAKCVWRAGRVVHIRDAIPWVSVDGAVIPGRAEGGDALRCDTRRWYHTMSSMECTLARNLQNMPHLAVLGTVAVRS